MPYKMKYIIFLSLVAFCSSLPYYSQYARGTGGGGISIPVSEGEELYSPSQALWQKLIQNYLGRGQEEYGYGYLQVAQQPERQQELLNPEQ